MNLSVVIFLSLYAKCYVHSSKSFFFNFDLLLITGLGPGLGKGYKYSREKGWTMLPLPIADSKK